MRRDDVHVRELLGDAWERWAGRCQQLTSDRWSTPTRCKGWDVRALVAHLCPAPTMFDELGGAIVDAQAEVVDGAEMLRRFNEPGGLAHTSADDLSERAVTDSGQLSADEAVDRFTRCAQIVRETPMSHRTVIRYPVVGTTTLAVIAEVALMEATVHLLDLADAVGGVRPSDDALAATRDLLVRIPDPATMVDVLGGRAAPDVVIPVIR